MRQALRLFSLATCLAGLSSLCLAQAPRERSQDNQPRQSTDTRQARDAQASPSMSQGSLTLPSSEVIQLDVSLPQEVRVADAFEYQIRVSNVSNNLLLSDVQLKQHRSGHPDHGTGWNEQSGAGGD